MLDGGGSCIQWLSRLVAMLSLLAPQERKDSRTLRMEADVEQRTLHAAELFRI